MSKIYWPKLDCPSEHWKIHSSLEINRGKTHSHFHISVWNDIPSSRVESSHFHIRHRNWIERQYPSTQNAIRVLSGQLRSKGQLLSACRASATTTCFGRRDMFGINTHTHTLTRHEPVTCDCKRLIIKSSSDAAHTICNRYKYVQSPHHFVSAMFSWCDVRVFVIVSLQFCFFVAQPCTWWYRTEDRLIKRVCL